MDHETVREEIPAYVAGRLEREPRDALERHLEGCGPCREMVTTWRQVAGAWKDAGPEMLAPHPSPADLRAHAKGAPAGDGTVARHLEVCASCSLEVTGWRRRSPSRRRLQVSIGVLSAAAGVVLGVGLAILVLGRTPEASTWSGAVDLLTLDAPLRGGTVASIELLDGQPYAVIAVALDAAGPPERMEFQVRDGEGAVLWRSEPPSAAVERQLRSIGVVTLLVPAARLAGEQFRLVVVADGGEQRLDVPFRILRRATGS